ncbi:hypothetical protein SAMN00768000_0278 [Sulfobacillus thermosulfidooxidans DSM 9293]|uniref:Uncharacterized protein n=1 Tax=Sulfobacillus thermosulfidooxidans (strain DSM 9293 / VKM B-1269 / AT-1) TaxID=929705 RepID=A0A1W1W6Z9_SULTA|nr:hypothetical protein [Sulfobacillus thermosulfidooxidans]SMC02067.1 hypothetical protein SAMN00768000_0278 [Sulfobacillus thermosulfidooxidans DSM 9293]
MVTLTVREEGSAPGNTVRHPVYVSQQLYEMIEMHARQSEQTLSEWMRQAVIRWTIASSVPQLPPAPPRESLIRDRMMWVYLPPSLNAWVNQARGSASWSTALWSILQWAVTHSEEGI